MLGERNMTNHLTGAWTGASGRKYVYEINARHPKLSPNEPSNYIYAKMNEYRRWVRIYIGEGNLTQRAATAPRRIECTDEKGATRLHLHVNYDRDDRETEVNDLLENFPRAYALDGCNEKKGG
jgi:hypothetical protein